MKWKDVERLVVELSPDEYNDLRSVVSQARAANIGPAVRVEKCLEDKTVAWRGDEQRPVRELTKRTIA